MPTSLEDLRRRASLGRDPLAALAYAKALLRHNDITQAVEVLSPYLGEPDVYPLLDPLPCWSHKEGDAGASRYLDTDLIAHPTLRWIAPSRRRTPDEPSLGRLLASPLGVAIQHQRRSGQCHLLVLNPHDGSEISQTDTFGPYPSMALLGGILLRCFHSKVQAFDLEHLSHTFQRRFDHPRPSPLHVSMYDFSRRGRSPFLASGVVPLEGALGRARGAGGYVVSRGLIASWGWLGEGFAPHLPGDAWLRVLVGGSRLLVNLVTGEREGADLHAFEPDPAGLQWTLAWVADGAIERADAHGTLIWEQNRLCTLRDPLGRALWRVSGMRSVVLGAQAVALSDRKDGIHFADRASGEVIGTISAGLRAQMVGVRGGFYLGVNDEVRALDLTGQTRWSVNLTACNPLASKVDRVHVVALAPQHGRIYVLDSQGTVYCF